VLKDQRVTSALIGARTVGQLEDSLAAVRNLDFSGDELARIDQLATDAGIDIWRDSSSVTEAQ
jgi:L-glyceraldehyde 3-phosphate reductase